MVARKMSKRELAIKYEDHIENSTNLQHPTQGHSLTGMLLMLDLIGEIRLELHVLHLSLRSRLF